MNNDILFFLVGHVTILTLVSICVGLRKKQTEVDTVLTEQKSNQSSEKAILAENSDISPSSKTTFGNEDIAPSTESFPADGEILIDWSVLQNYSDNLGYWISQFEFVIDFVTLPFFVSLLGDTCIKTLCPGEYPYFKYYTFFGSLPVSLPLQSVVDQYTADKKYSSKLTDLVMDTNKTNPLLVSLEVKLFSSMQEPTLKVKLAQYRWIKEYVKDHQISERSLFKVYLYVLNYKEFGGIKYSEKLTSAEASLMINH